MTQSAYNSTRTSMENLERPPKALFSISILPVRHDIRASSYLSDLTPHVLRSAMQEIDIQHYQNSQIMHIHIKENLKN